MGNKVLVLGLDGFTWKTLDYLGKDLEMKNLEKLRENSAWGTLKSTTPPNTIPAWISFATGCNPGKHGVFDFLKPSTDLSDVSPVCSRDIKVDTLQQLIKRNGLKSVIFNLPGSTPALTDDITIGGFLSAKKDNIYPPELKELDEIKNSPDIKYEGGLMLEDRRVALKKILQRLEWRLKLGKRLFSEKWDFYFILVSETDMLQHIIFDQIKKGKLDDSIKKSVIDIYRKIDDALGWYSENIDDKTYMIIVSDHGFDSYDYLFSLKNFLRQNNLTAFHKAGKGEPEYLKKRWSGKSERANLDVSPAINFMYARPFTRKILDAGRNVYRRLVLSVPLAKYVGIKGYRMYVDPSNSIAMPLTIDGFSVYLNKKSRFRNGIIENDARELEKIKTLLENEKSPFTGESPFRKIHYAKDFYSGSHTHEGPDILIELKDHAIIGDAHFSDVYYKTNKNYHNMDGIFAISGPGINKGNVSDKHLIDIAPTVLHLMGLAVPSHMDGVPATGTFGNMDSVRRSDSSKLTELKSRIKRLRQKEANR